MALNLFSRLTKTAGILLAVMSIVACGGGGGGSDIPSNPPPVTPPPVTPPPAGDTTAPTILSVTPSADAPIAVLSPFAITFSEAITCPALSWTGTFGEVTGTVTCISANTTGKGVWTLVPSVPLLYSKSYTLRVAGYQDLAGNTGVPYTSAFVTEKLPGIAGLKLFVANSQGGDAGETPVAIVDGTTRAVSSRVDFPRVPGFSMPYQVAVDGNTGIGYVAPKATMVLYRFKMATGEALPPFVIDPTEPGILNGIRGVATKERAVYVALGRYDWRSYYLRGALQGWDQLTGQKLFITPKHFLASETMIVTRLLASKQQKMLYAVAVHEDSVEYAFQSTVNGSSRSDFLSGMPGRVTEVDVSDPNTPRITRTWTIGSGANDIAEVGDKLYVVNSGDKTLSIIDLKTGAVTTVDWRSQYGPYENPVTITPDPERGVYYVSRYLDAVSVYSFADHKEVGRITTGTEVLGVAVAGGKLWIAARIDFFNWKLIRTLTVVNRETLQIEQVIPDVGPGPAGITFYDPSQP